MKNIWTCKVGENVGSLPDGADGPMREAVEDAYRALTGRDPEFTFSGWAGALTEAERACVEDRLPHGFADADPNDHDLIGQTDASLFAHRLVRRIHENPSIATDEDTLIAWFAVAIEAGRAASVSPALPAEEQGDGVDGTGTSRDGSVE